MSVLDLSQVLDVFSSPCLTSLVSCRFRPQDFFSPRSTFFTNDNLAIVGPPFVLLKMLLLFRTRAAPRFRLPFGWHRETHCLW